MQTWLAVLTQPLRPLSAAVADYNLVKFRHDLIAGLNVSVLALPQAIAYAFIAGVPPEYGIISLII